MQEGLEEPYIKSEQTIKIPPNQTLLLRVEIHQGYITNFYKSSSVQTLIPVQGKVNYALLTRQCELCFTAL